MEFESPMSLAKKVLLFAISLCLHIASGNLVNELQAIAANLPAILADDVKREQLMQTISMKEQKVLIKLGKKLAELVAESQQQCIEHLFLNRTSQAFSCFATRHLLSRRPALSKDALAQESTTLLKLQHDLEMYEYLQERGLLPGMFHGAVSLFRSVLTSASERYAKKPTASFSVKLDDNPLWMKTHNRAVVWGASGSSERLEGGLISNELQARAQEIVTQYHSNRRGVDAECADQDGWVVVDNVLRPEALQRLETFLVDSTFYYSAKQGGHYLMATLEDGLASPLLLQFVEELRAAFPQVLGQHYLRMGWAFKYDNTQIAPIEVNVSSHGVPLHADAAAVNVNFWVIDPEDKIEGSIDNVGGLTLWQAEAPANDKFGNYNNAADSPEIRELCARSRQDEIEYRANRLVMFNSNLFHATQPIRVKPGFRKRRINLTLLFGDRCGKYTGDQL